MARPKNKIERVQTGIRLQPEVIRAMKHFAIDMGKPFNVIMEEAAIEYLKRHGRDFGAAESLKK